MVAEQARITLRAQASRAAQWAITDFATASAQGRAARYESMSRSLRALPHREEAPLAGRYSGSERVIAHMDARRHRPAESKFPRGVCRRRGADMHHADSMALILGPRRQGAAVETRAGPVRSVAERSSRLRVNLLGRSCRNAVTLDLALSAARTARDAGQAGGGSGSWQFAAASGAAPIASSAQRVCATLRT